MKYLVIFLFKEQIPHTTKFEKLVSLTCRMSDDIDTWTKSRDQNATYRSKASVTEFLELFEKQISDDTCADLSASVDIYRSWTIKWLMKLRFTITHFEYLCKVHLLQNW